MAPTGKPDMKLHFFLIALALTVFCPPAIASEVYTNSEYSFSVPLTRDMKICSQDAHGVTIAFGSAGCGHTDVYISATYNGPLDATFPSKAHRETCGSSPILLTGLQFESSEWRYCTLHSSSKRVELFYFNRVMRPATSSVPWMYLSVDAQLAFGEVNSSRRQLNALISSIVAKK